MSNNSDFPASANTPGQAVSRSALAKLSSIGVNFLWWQAFEELHESRRYRNWRICAYIAWASAPIENRIPQTQEEFATLIGLKTSQAIRRWRAADDSIDTAIMDLRVGAIFAHTADVLTALTSQAKKDDHRSHQDRKLFLEMVGITPQAMARRRVGAAEDDWWSAADGDESAAPVVAKMYETISPDDWNEDS